MPDAEKSWSGALRVRRLPRGYVGLGRSSSVVVDPVIGLVIFV
jgi:hypothetical protein